MDKELERKVLAFEKICYEPFYQKVTEGFIYEKEDIYHALEFFTRILDTKKADFLANILDKYYGGYIKEEFNKSIEEERFEICSRIKKYIK